MPDVQVPPLDSSRQRWPWWPLLPLYPYGRRPTLIRELVPGRVWSFEQLHGVWYVAVPIRMTVLKVEGGLMLYAPIPATAEVLEGLRSLERQHGPVLSIVLPTASGLEHKIPVPAMARAFPEATVWVTERQWSFPIQLPGSWIGFPRDRTRVLQRDGLPHGDQLAWIPLGPIDLGLGTFLELACLDQATGSLLVTDALVSFSSTPPLIFELDPTPLLFHSRDCGSQPLVDNNERRVKGWKRILLFANYFRPECVSVPRLPFVLKESLEARERQARSHFGIYPFQWNSDWEQQADHLLASSAGSDSMTIAPVLERLVYVRNKVILLRWICDLANRKDIKMLIPAHYDAPIQLSAASFRSLASDLEHREWAPSHGSWQLLASIDQSLIRFGVISE